MYKRKDKKIRPMNVLLSDGINPEGEINLGINPRPQIIPRGSRLTPERLAAMQIGAGFLSEPERQSFIDILFKYESAIIFEDSEDYCDPRSNLLLLCIQFLISPGSNRIYESLMRKQPLK